MPEGIPDTYHVCGRRLPSPTHINKNRTANTVPAHRYTREVRHRRPEQKTGNPLDEKIRMRKFRTPYIKGKNYTTKIA